MQPKSKLLIPILVRQIVKENNSFISKNILEFYHHFNRNLLKTQEFHKTFHKICFFLKKNIKYIYWLDGRMAMHRSAKPFMSVRFRLQPLFTLVAEPVDAIDSKSIKVICGSSSLSKGTEGCSSVGRVLVSKTKGHRFDPYHSCFFYFFYFQEFNSRISIQEFNFTKLYFTPIVESNYGKSINGSSTCRVLVSNQRS